MCLIVLSYRHHPGFRLILAANRDEFYDRPTRSLSFWQDRPDILAGLDMRGGGTWLGITKTGRIAAITNFRHIPSMRQDAPSRGMLVKDFLTGDVSPTEYAAHVQSIGNRYNGFNLIVGDAESLLASSRTFRTVFAKSAFTMGLYANALIPIAAEFLSDIFLL
jgi:uncharacterized protein with NRDE domain